MNGNGQLPASNERQVANCKATYDELLEEHKQLKIEHEQLQSKISTPTSSKLIIRPYRTGFTRSDARKGFEDLMRNIVIWVEKHTDKFMDDGEFPEQWLDSLKHFPQVATRFRQLLDFNPDLSAAVGYPDSDQDIVSACIMRWVWQRVFGDASCSISSDKTELLKNIEQTMSECTTPRLDITAIHTWHAQAHHALFSTPEYAKARQASIDALTEELAQILTFLSSPSKSDEFIGSISAKIIQPSMDLYENFRRSQEKYYIETSQWVKPGALMSHDLPDGRLQGLLNDLHCVNTAKYKAIFLVDQLNPRPTTEELQKQLHFICSICPALKVREFQRSGGREIETVCKESVLVAWDPERLQGDPRTLKEKTWLSRVCSL
ncbi:hypothetical protein F4824DRAFT_487962 [Ustulina deusta]|nr:hypothetical protein F4824DRAFT_487962 [Ustulina deusta]